MPSTSSTQPIIVAALLCLTATGLLFAPPEQTDGIRNSVRDAILPGESLVHSTVGWYQSSVQRIFENQQIEQPAAHLETQLDFWKLRCRRLQIENAMLHKKLQQRPPSRNSPLIAATSEPLVIPELLEARVVGREMLDSWRAGRLIDKGLVDGIPDSAFVVAAPTPVIAAVIDQGLDQSLETGQPVYSGRKIIGRIARVGKWVSTVQPITDSAFRGLAQLVRGDGKSSVFGAEGILEGDNEKLCRLKFVSSGEPVSVGDNVFTGGRNRLIPFPMYYGKVVRAELKPGAPHWEIWVQPAFLEDDIESVQVLRLKPNPSRVSAN